MRTGLLMIQVNVFCCCDIFIKRFFLCVCVMVFIYFLWWFVGVYLLVAFSSKSYISIGLFLWNPFRVILVVTHCHTNSIRSHWKWKLNLNFSLLFFSLFLCAMGLVSSNFVCVCVCVDV